MQNANLISSQLAKIEDRARFNGEPWLIQRCKRIRLALPLTVAGSKEAHDIILEGQRLIETYGSQR